MGFVGIREEPITRPRSRLVAGGTKSWGGPLIEIWSLAEDLTSGVEALVHRVAGALDSCCGAGQQVSAHEADEEREVGVAEERNEGIGEVQELGEGAEGDHQQGHQDG